MDRYGPELEFDLHPLGLDLLDFIRGVHPWGKLLRIADQLPRASRYQAALADDDEMAEQYLAHVGVARDEMEREGKVYRPRTLAGWTDEVATMADLADAMNQLHATLIQANSAKGASRPTVNKYPRPVTALDRARRQRDIAQAAQVRDAFSPREG